MAKVDHFQRNMVTWFAGLQELMETVCTSAKLVHIVARHQTRRPEEGKKKVGIDQASIPSDTRSMFCNSCSSKLGKVVDLLEEFFISATSFHYRTSPFFLYLFNTLPLHSLKYNSQRLNRRNRG